MQAFERAELVQNALKSAYPDIGMHLVAENPWEILVATVLSAQCTDARVNIVTPCLFSRWPTPEAMAGAAQEDLEECIRSTGFYHNKAKNIISTAKKIVQNHAGQVPKSMNELVALDGVARKTANVVLSNAFGINEGIAIDTHVGRIARRLGLTANTDPDKVERDLMPLFPQKEWGDVNHRMVSFGRDVCTARSPHCADCPMQRFCPRIGLASEKV